ncbi:MAG: aminodeoxychorismate synthase component I [Erythrobacter sp.]|jgi:para-aminobenzoate synthetase/4-amino-4-deoxychorismate lyase|nr:aminodeoxychorismate synthase component I [Erythrobacter sp.]
MGRTAPFILLDDASEGAGDALFFEAPAQVFAAHRPGEVTRALTEAQAALDAKGGTLAGMFAYEAGLALEPRLAGLAEARHGAAGPLVWLARFEAEPERIAPEEVPAWLAARGEGHASLGPLDPQLSPGGYERAFDKVREAILAGDIYQANFTYPLVGTYRGDPLALYAALRPAARSGYGALLFDGTHYLASLSPEMFFESDGRAVHAKPMKGTRPRLASPEADRAMAQDLASSEKDRAENLMIVDLMRNDLARVAEPGSVRVEAPFAIESYPSVHQMVSHVHARLTRGVSAMDLVKALFPCGSITGAPKIRAMEVIARHERDARGPYCGAIGMIAADGRAAFNVAIRTLRLTPIENDQGTAVLGVGSAIVADSKAMTERRECEVKAGFARAALGELAAPACDLIETMRFEPEAGVLHLERHLERMKRSAQTLGHEFDRHAARNQIQALCFELDAPAKLRLLASRRGAIALETGPLPHSPDGQLDCVALPHPLDPSDWRLAHKTSDRGFYEEALAAARNLGAREAILVREDGLVTEGCYTNIFVDPAGTGEGVLLTPRADLGLLPGILREHLITEGRAREAELTLDDLANGFWLGNSVRGLVAARLV